MLIFKKSSFAFSIKFIPEENKKEIEATVKITIHKHFNNSQLPQLLMLPQKVLHYELLDGAMYNFSNPVCNSLPLSPTQGSKSEVRIMLV